jgi:menaquinone-dependent protoporphyrinogen oxidase
MRIVNTAPTGSATDGPRVLIAFASHEGQTERVVHRIAESLRRGGARVDVVPVQDEPHADDHDLVLVAGSIHAGRHDRQLEAWAGAHAASLAARPNALLTVSLTAHDEGGDAGETLAGFDAALRTASGWAPDDALHVAGALDFGKMNPIKRWMMRMIARSAGLIGTGDPRTSAHEWTDWSRVDAFADYLLDRARRGA